MIDPTLVLQNDETGTVLGSLVELNYFHRVIADTTEKRFSIYFLRVTINSTQSHNGDFVTK